MKNINKEKQQHLDNAFIPQKYLESLDRICDLLEINEINEINTNYISRKQEILNILTDIKSCKKFFNLLCSQTCDITKNKEKQEYLFNIIEIFNKAFDICLDYHGVDKLSSNNFFNIFLKNTTIHYVYQAIRCGIKPNLSNRIRISSDGTKVDLDSNSYLMAAYFGMTDVMDLLEKHYPDMVTSIDEASRGTPIVFLLKYLYHAPKVSKQTPFFAFGYRYDSIDFSRRYKKVLSQEKHFRKWLNHPLNIFNWNDIASYRVSQKLIWSSLCGFHRYSLFPRVNYFGHEIEMDALIKNNRRKLVRKLVNYGLDPVFFPVDFFELMEDKFMLNMVKNHIISEFESNQLHSSSTLDSLKLLKIT